jgi:glycosyltransferase involved in cell wall biosynthesis
MREIPFYPSTNSGLVFKRNIYYEIVDLREINMKKGILASFMVALMLVTVLSAVVTADAISIRKEIIEDKNPLYPNLRWDLYRHFMFGHIYNLSIENDSSNHVTYEFESDNIWGLEITRKSRPYGWEIERRFYHHKGHVYWHFGGIKFRGIIVPGFICGYFQSRY